MRAVPRSTSRRLVPSGQAVWIDTVGPVHRQSLVSARFIAIPHDREGTTLSGRFSLRTLGHATLIVSEGGRPLLATDPWLVGSTYWRSWWLDQYPSNEEIAAVAASRYVYVTHGHPDHYHLPSLRRLGNPSTLHPDFPDYDGPSVLRHRGIRAVVLLPGRWYEVTRECRIASIPVFADDSLLVVDTPYASVVNLNDCAAPPSLSRMIRKIYLTADKPVVVLKSHSPASSGASMYRKGVHAPLHQAPDYARIAGNMANSLGATAVVSFASQAFFARADSRWANEHRVFWDDLVAHWQYPDIDVLPPHVTVDLETLTYSSTYRRRRFVPDAAQLEKIEERERSEETFELPDDFTRRLEQYLSEVWFLRLVFRHGIGWTLRTSQREYFYDVRKRTLSERIPEYADATVTVADQMLYEALVNGNVTDLGITMTIRTDSRVDIRRPYAFFSLVGLRDAGHVRNWSSLLRFGWFSARVLAPNAFWFWWHKQAHAGPSPVARLHQHDPSPEPTQ
jgi:hypothetical protein